MQRRPLLQKHKKGSQTPRLFHPDYHRRLRNHTESADPALVETKAGARGLVQNIAITAGGELHPALRTHASDCSRARLFYSRCRV